MVTGDNIHTTKAIAFECGILREGQSIETPTIIEGRVFRNYTKEERLNIVENICVSMCVPILPPNRHTQGKKVCLQQLLVKEISNGRNTILFACR